MKLIIGKYYRLNRKRLREYILSGWDDTIYKDSTINRLKITELTTTDIYSDLENLISKYNIKEFYGVEYSDGVKKRFFLPSDCLFLRKDKLERNLKLNNMKVIEKKLISTGYLKVEELKVQSGEKVVSRERVNHSDAVAAVVFNTETKKYQIGRAHV